MIVGEAGAAATVAIIFSEVGTAVIAAAVAGEVCATVEVVRAAFVTAGCAAGVTAAVV
jgi:hypothetical protein